MKVKYDSIIGDIHTSDGVLYPPKTLSLHLTDRCNSKCIFCGEDSHSSLTDTVQSKQLISFLDEHDPSEWTAVNIHGGEPTIRPDFINLLSYIRKSGYKTIILQTNALMLGLKEFSRRVHEIGIDIYTVGFHAHESKLMDTLTRIPDSFDRIINGIRSIKKNDNYLRTTTVACSGNYRHLTDICKKGIDEGVDHINISAMQPGGSAFRELDNLLIGYDECRPYIEQAIEYAITHDRKVTLEGFPLCAVPAYSRYYVDWSKQRLNVLYREMRMSNFNEFLTVTTRIKNGPCTNCPCTEKCCGVYKDYVKKIGWKGIGI